MPAVPDQTAATALAAFPDGSPPIRDRTYRWTVRENDAALAAQPTGGSQDPILINHPHTEDQLRDTLYSG
ncbi:hypothetical protein AAW14_00200 [Streptomyces hygroscopicus]|nr:hypothetical protein [Streptomyces hygroscopicus]